MTARAGGRRSETRLRLSLSLMLLLGVLLLLYPQTANWFSQANTSELTDEYAEEFAGDAAAEYEAELDRARAYNDALETGAAYDPFTMGVADLQSPQYRAYLDELSDGSRGVMARVRIPEIGVKLPVFHGTTDSTLLRGAGHLFGTALPVGGAGTHSVITGHSGLADAVLFTDLGKLRAGDAIYIDVYGETLMYRVTGSEKVRPHETESLASVEGEDRLTLVTCTPVGINSHRLLVHAERVFPLPPNIDPAEAPDAPGFPWWIVWSSLVVLASAGYVANGAMRDRRARTASAAADAGAGAGAGADAAS